MEEAFASLTESQARFLALAVGLGCRFVILGGYGMRCHGLLRAAHDLDVYIGHDEQTVNAMANVLTELGSHTGDELRVQLLKSKAQIRCGLIDVLTPFAELDFESSYERSESGSAYGLELRVLSAEDLLLSKRLSASEREQDAEDVAWLEAKIAESKGTEGISD